LDENIVNQVVKIVRSNIPTIPEDFSQLNSDLSQLGMDSIIFIRIVVAIEEAFDMEVPDEKLLITEMGTIQKMVEVVCTAT